MKSEKLYSKSGKLRGTLVHEESGDLFEEVRSLRDYYNHDKEDFLRKIEGGHEWNAATSEFQYTYSNNRTQPIPPQFFTCQQPPAVFEDFEKNLPVTYLLDGIYAVADERRGGRVRVPNCPTVLVAWGTEKIAGHQLEGAYYIKEIGKLSEVYVDDILRPKEYKFANPDTVWPKHKANHAMNGQKAEYRDLVAALESNDPFANPDTVWPSPVTKAGAIRCLWETLGGSVVHKLAVGDKCVYLNTAISHPYQLAFLVASGYKLFSRTLSVNQRKDHFAVKGQ